MKYLWAISRSNRPVLRFKSEDAVVRGTMFFTNAGRVGLRLYGGVRCHRLELFDDVGEAVRAARAHCNDLKGET